MLTRYISSHFTAPVTEGQQKFVVEPQGDVVRPGTNHTLHCNIANMGELSQCRWQKDYKPVGIFTGKYSIPENSRQTGQKKVKPFFLERIFLGKRLNFISFRYLNV